MARIRKQVTRAGKMLEVKYFPCYQNGKRMPGSYSSKNSKTPEQIAEANRRKAIRKFVLLVNTNFDENDYYCAFDYSSENAPLSYERAEKNMQNFIRRIKNYRKKKGLDNSKFKYIYSIHEVEYKTGKNKGKTNFHHHMFISGLGLTTKELKALWPYGTKGNIVYYDPIQFGPEAAARYLVGKRANKKIYKCSKNLDKPIVEERKDGQISKKKLDALGSNRIDDREYWEQKYPSYSFVRCDKYFNEINLQWYFTLIMYKKENSNTYYSRMRKRQRY